MAYTNAIANNNMEVDALLSIKTKVLDEQKHAESKFQQSVVLSKTKDESNKVDSDIREQQILQQNEQQFALLHEEKASLNVENSFKDVDNVNNAYSLKKRESANIVASVVFCMAKVQEYLMSIANSKYMQNLNLLLLKDKNSDNLVFTYSEHKVTVKEKNEDALIARASVNCKQEAKQEETYQFSLKDTQTRVIRKQVTKAVDELLKKDALDIKNDEKEKIISTVSKLIGNIEDQGKSSQIFNKIVADYSANNPIVFKTICKALLLFKDFSNQPTPSFFQRNNESSTSKHLENFLKMSRIAQMFINDTDANPVNDNDNTFKM